MNDKSLCDRKFKLWFYQVSHSEAIIRSPKFDSGQIYDTNIDIYLGDIVYIEVPTSFKGLSIGSATIKDADYLTERLGRDIMTEQIIVLLSEGRKYYIVAGIIKIMENDLEFGELPIHTFL